MCVYERGRGGGEGMQSRMGTKKSRLSEMTRGSRNWKSTFTRVWTLVLCIFAVQGFMLVTMSTESTAEEECVAPAVCAMICEESFDSTMRDELKEMCGCDESGDLSTPVPETEESVEVFFVQRAEFATLSNTTLTLFDVGSVIWFTDRPDRAAGVWKDKEYLTLFAPPPETGEASNDTNTFSEDPPNAVLACTLEPSGEELNVVMELMDPVVSSSDDNSVSFSVSILEDVTGIFSSHSSSTTSMVRCTSVHVFVDSGGFGSFPGYTFGSSNND